MSHASGFVTFQDGLKLWFEYDGTSDVCISQLYKTYDEMLDNWRNGKFNECTCDNDENVVITSNYGSGSSWDGKACRHCMCITDGLTKYSYYDDRASWFE